MDVQLHLRVVGTLLLLLASLNTIIPKRFNWRKDLAQLSLLNRQIFLVHAFFIALVLVLMGLLCLALPETLLVPTTLAKAVLTGLVVFWGARLFIQWFVYDRRLWRGNRFNTAMHVVFTGVWIYFVAVYGWALWLQF